jgi:molybdopterin synthase catalytic subunit
MIAPLFAVTEEPVSAEHLGAALEAPARTEGEGCGAICAFLGVVRATHQGRAVRYLEYEAFAPLAVKAFERIRDEVVARWPGTTLAIHHRTGRLSIGEASIAIVAAAAHRDQAFRASRYAIERVKQIAPVWKHEFFDDGDAWVEGATADIDDEAARAQALAIACA